MTESLFHLTRSQLWNIITKILTTKYTSPARNYPLGTWTTAALEKKSNLKTLNLPLDKKVYFAGEIYYPYQQMGVPGAILSGYYSADKLLTE